MNKDNTPTTAAQASAATKNEEVSSIVTFGKPYHFEGTDYESVDLSGLDNLTAENMIAADKYLTSNGVFTPMPEMNLEYALFIASTATGFPVEFFRNLPPKDAIKVKNRVTNFFYAEG